MAAPVEAGHGVGRQLSAPSSTTTTTTATTTTTTAAAADSLRARGKRSTKPESLPLAKQLLYAVGQMGWAALYTIVSLQLVYFYLPPRNGEDGETFFPVFIIQDHFMVVFNMIALLATAGRVWDAVTDPLIATFSDRLDHPRGRRIPCLAVGAAPAALFCVLMFVPVVGEESTWNVVWLAANLTLFYFFLSVYCTPYFSMLPELGHTTEDRLNLSTWLSITYTFGAMLASAAPTIGSSFGFDNTASLQAGICTICAFGGLCMYVPVFSIDERRYCDSQPSQAGMVLSMRHCLGNPHFRCYVAADFCYWFSVGLVTTGLPYFLTVLVQLPADLQLAFMVTVLVVPCCLYYPVNLAARRVGKKRPILVALAVMVVVFGLIFILGMDWVPLSPTVQMFGIGLVLGLGLSVLGVLPNAVLADIAASDAAATGESHEGMFFAARAMLAKLGTSVAILLFASLTNFGKDVGDDLGIRLSGLVGMAFPAASFVIFTGYQEHAVAAILVDLDLPSAPAPAPELAADPATGI